MRSTYEKLTTTKTKLADLMEAMDRLLTARDAQAQIDLKVLKDWEKENPDPKYNDPKTQSIRMKNLQNPKPGPIKAWFESFLGDMSRLDDIGKPE